MPPKTKPRKKTKNLLGAVAPVKSVSEVIIPGMITRDMLSEEQAVALETMEQHITNNKDCQDMLLAGYAGTGKSSCIRLLLNKLDDLAYNIVCTAPTNEAVRVISKLSGRAFSYTIYSLLGLAPVREDDGEAALKEVGESKLHKFDVVICDESSMLDDEMYNWIMNKVSRLPHLKIIFIGDNAQLPPVRKTGMGGKKESLVFNTKKKVQLVKVQRVAEHNPILKVVTSIRDNLASPVDVWPHQSQIDPDSGVGIVMMHDKRAFVKQIYESFCSDRFKENPNSFRVLAYTNKVVDSINREIRKQIYGVDVTDYVEDETIIVSTNPVMEDKEIVYTVGERLKILSVNERDDNKHGLKYFDLRVINYEAVEPARAVISVLSTDPVNMAAYKVCISNLALEAKEKISKGMLKVLAWKDYFKFVSKFNKVAYIYAMTVHRAQGSTFETVYAINNDFDILQWDHVERNQLKYVAFTRPSKKLVIYTPN